MRHRRLLSAAKRLARFSTDAAQRTDHRLRRGRADPAPANDLPGVRSIHQVNDMYLVVETEAGLRIIDQHALHEKALYLLLQPGQVDMLGGGIQELLLPQAIELSASEVAAVEPHLPGLPRAALKLRCLARRR